MLNIDANFFLNPKILPAFIGAEQQTLRAIGVKFSETAKQLTTDEGHVVTGRYRRSIGNTSTSDGIFRYTPDGKSLDVGTNVPYSSVLEGRYSILARTYDIVASNAMGIVGKVFTTYFYSHS